MEQTVTAELRLYPTAEQTELPARTMDKYMNACGYISIHVYEIRTTDYHVLREELYGVLRYGFGLGAQTTRSAVRTVPAAYKTIESTGRREVDGSAA